MGVLKPKKNTVVVVGICRNFLGANSMNSQMVN